MHMHMQMYMYTSLPHANICLQAREPKDIPAPACVTNRSSLETTHALSQHHTRSFLAFPFVNMFRSALPRVSRALPHNATASKRFLTTAPPHKTSRSWKNSAARWTLAGGLIYYYNTSSVFAEEPVCTSFYHCHAQILPKRASG